MPTFDVFKHVRPCPGYQVGGDAALFYELDRGIFLAIIDVPGHGLEAHNLARAIEAFLMAHASAHVTGLINALHHHLHGSRGACAGLCYIESATGLVRYAGIGDTILRRFGKQSGHLPSWPGIIGHHMRTPREEQLSLKRDDVLMMYTDGVRDSFTLEDYPQLLHDDVQTIVQTIVERFGRTYDDASCLALRYCQ